MSYIIQDVFYFVKVNCDVHYTLIKDSDANVFIHRQQYLFGGKKYTWGLTVILLKLSVCH